MNAKINAECTSEEAQAFLGVSDGPHTKSILVDVLWAEYVRQKEITLYIMLNL